LGLLITTFEPPLHLNEVYNTGVGVTAPTLAFSFLLRPPILMLIFTLVVGSMGTSEHGLKGDVLFSG